MWSKRWSEEPDIGVQFPALPPFSKKETEDDRRS